ncbi:unnamed protein product [Microthlaspi erraticum]|uniref:Uncharacterized protein n=1 Tax=Microthlaspi erraticum TaxID=1685480 RepID=A0A6D2HNH0_9BRAS|nr:unnamed protein product [Microthlaspi erraticum]
MAGSSQVFRRTGYMRFFLRLNYSRRTEEQQSLVTKFLSHHFFGSFGDACGEACVGAMRMMDREESNMEEAMERSYPAYLTSERSYSAYLTPERSYSAYLTSERSYSAYLTSERSYPTYLTPERSYPAYLTSERSYSTYLTPERSYFVPTSLIGVALSAYLVLYTKFCLLPTPI